MESVILGGGYAGLLAASVISQAGYDVLVLDDGTAPETGTAPLPRHGAVLRVGGIGDIGDLVYGSRRALEDEGAQTSPAEIAGHAKVTHNRSGHQAWEAPSLLTCTWELLNHTLRHSVLASPEIGRETTVWDTTTAVGLIGNSRAVQGVRVRHLDGTETTITAELVVDASGPTSDAPAWLSRLGVPAIPTVTDRANGITATRIYRPAPSGNDLAMMAANSCNRRAVFVPVENGRWHVTQQLPASEFLADETFEQSVLTETDPILGELLNGAEPLSEVAVSRMVTSRWRRYDQLRSWPRGFIAIGDAVATWNPLYLHGPQAAEAGARALREALAHGINDPALARRTQQMIGRAVADLRTTPGTPCQQRRPHHDNAVTRRRRLVAGATQLVSHCIR
ncbi:FAD-dependent monooxygenase [Streptomyces sp. NPDC059650]|uniref:FAD-dependent monooxygenase n=1 Tax=Streptomyces sp. NPDC059650 TaxID=3346896 RepID=UPI0036B8DD64